MTKSAKARRQRLGRLQTDLEAALMTDEQLSRMWFWKNETLVLEYSTSYGVKYAFDINCTASGYNLQIVGRGDPSRYAVRQRIGVISKAVKGHPNRILETWPLTVDRRTLVLELVTAIRRVQSLMSVVQEHPDRYVPGYWWDQQSNFGDQIGPWLIEMITGRPAFNTIALPNAGHAVMTAGSIITGMNRPGMSVWGSGLIAPIDSATAQRLKSRQPHTIRAVRGELTRTELVENLGWDVPELFGDPALLLSTFYRPHALALGEPRPAVVPHYAHRSLFEGHSERREFDIIDVRKSPEAVVAQIANASTIASTSLHGLIIAQAYGVPWIRLRISDQHLVGQDFKFEDFYSTISRDQVAEISLSKDDVSNADLREILKSASIPDSRYDVASLIRAFPSTDIPQLPGDYASYRPRAV
ncbi:polysaccharide pyruvyl transferase family protein [Brevibacterium sp. UCMA 11754]|uniref:polysaccharide pyruvyl transferase family protein n=1 Tax=Brevibacterium sp. UCMA 11754 TaxID=2749198 RepID=UPI001F25501C|nr:polysaccharide pyruvyl transferase family protein [Brevibacterium sp. UCMA 11754]MCF2573881.1 polysaccharide pyruvyl transferase family protein [Brevibacterium sp. UCMA 11754]